jgi:lipoprotein
MKSNKYETSSGVNITLATILACLVVLLVAISTLFIRDAIHSATLPDEDQAQCESLGGKWSVNHQCYNAGEPTTIKKLKDSLKDAKYHE